MNRISDGRHLCLFLILKRMLLVFHHWTWCRHFLADIIIIIIYYYQLKFLAILSNNSFILIISVSFWVLFFFLCIYGDTANNINTFPDVHLGLPWRLSSKEYACNVEDTGSTPGLRRSLGEGNGNPLQYSCLGNPVDRGALQATAHGVAKESDMT